MKTQHYAIKHRRTGWTLRISYMPIPYTASTASITSLNSMFKSIYTPQHLNTLLGGYSITAYPAPPPPPRLDFIGSRCNLAESVSARDILLAAFVMRKAPK